MNLSILTHALGLDAEHRDPWRNLYVSDATDPEVDALVVAGLMSAVRTPSWMDAADRCYVVTDEGKCAAIAANERQNPPLKDGTLKAKGRYRDWLAISDLCPDLTFGKYLKERRYDRQPAGCASDGAS